MVNKVLCVMYSWSGHWPPTLAVVSASASASSMRQTGSRKTSVYFRACLVSGKSCRPTAVIGGFGSKDFGGLNSLHFLQTIPSPFYFFLFYISYRLQALLITARHFSAKRGIAIACRPSVCNVGGSGPLRLEILETNCADNCVNTFALPSPRPSTYTSRERGKFLGDVFWLIKCYFFGNFGDKDSVVIML